MKKRNKQNGKGVYLLLFTLCAACSLLISLSQLMDYGGTEDYFFPVQHFFLFLFTIDYLTELMRAPDKTGYLKRHTAELTAVYPFCLIFLPVSIIGISAMGYRKWKSYFKSRKLLSFFLLLGFVILLSALCLYRVEYGKSVSHFFDAIWLCVVTVTTVGYGDISPQTAMGKIILMVLMFFGVLFIGVVTTTMTAYLSRGERFSRRKLAIKSIRSVLEDLSTDELCRIERDLTETYRSSRGGSSISPSDKQKGRET